MKNKKTLIIKFVANLLFLGIYLGQNVYGETIEVGELDQLLRDQNYSKFETRLNEIIKDEKIQNKYLLNNIYSGHPVVYWVLGNHYAKNILSKPYLIANKEQLNFTKQMFYTALILTEQDGGSCMEITSKKSTYDSLKKYTYTVDFERKFTQNNLQNFNQSVTFIDKLTSRPSPKWACLEYGDIQNKGLLQSSYGKVLSGMEVAIERKNVIEKMRNSILRPK